MKLIPTVLIIALVSLVAPLSAAPKLRALIVDGQNNHDAWPKSTMMMKAMLEQTGLFTVDIRRTATTWKGQKWLAAYPLTSQPETKELPGSQTDPDFAPTFSDYAVVISNFGWKAAPWPEKTQRDFEQYVRQGGGFVVVHAANNSFPEWQDFNLMIGLGGWGNRNEKSGPYVYFDRANKLVRDLSPGGAGGHGPQHQFQITTREPNHPIMRGLPPVWLHTKDECYDKLRGPAENLTILATAYSSPDFKGTDRNEPALMALSLGKGRIFHTILGHDDYSFECVGFITTFCRGAEWAATGDVTIPVPADFPTADAVKSRPFPTP